MSLLQQFFFWLKTNAFGSVLFMIFSMIVIGRANGGVDELLLAIGILILISLLFTLPIQVILYFQLNPRQGKPQSKNRILATFTVMYCVLLIVLLFMLKLHLNIFVILLLSYFPISLLNLYKGITD